VGAKFTGDWDGITKMRQRMERNAPQFNKAISKYAAEKYVDTVKQMARAQDSGGERRWIISAAWIRIKGKLNPENQNKAWIDTETFLKNLRVVEVNRGMFFGGASAKDQYPGSNLTMAQIAAFGEFGTRHREPNKLFGPARLKTIQVILPELTEKAKRYITRDSYTE
jgi:hypothetical protein